MTKWMKDAACKGEDVDTFFRDGDRGHHRNALDNRAKAICSVCPVVEECLSYAVSANVTDGVWAGLTPKERQSMKRNRR